MFLHFFNISGAKRHVRKDEENLLKMRQLQWNFSPPICADPPQTKWDKCKYSQTNLHQRLYQLEPICKKLLWKIANRVSQTLARYKMSTRIHESHIHIASSQGTASHSSHRILHTTTTLSSATYTCIIIIRTLPSTKVQCFHQKRCKECCPNLQ